MKNKDFTVKELIGTGVIILILGISVSLITYITDIHTQHIPTVSSKNKSQVDARYNPYVNNYVLPFSKGAYGKFSPVYP